MLILNAADVARALPMPAAIAAMKRAFAALSAGEAVVPHRIHLPIERHAGVSLVMPSYVAGDKANADSLAVKVVSLFDGNRQRGLPRIQAAVLVLDPETGRPVALLEGATLTAIRTAAASGAATDLLARRDSRVVTLFGAGVQAAHHAEAICAVREIAEVRVYSRTQERLTEFCSALGSRRGDVRVIETSSPADALRGADIVCAASTSAEPVFADAELPPGAHVNAVGSYRPHVREIPGETVARALVVVDSRAAAWEEAGDLILPLEAGQIVRAHVHAELGELVLGRKSGRADDAQITLFKSVGIAAQDAVAAQAALDSARRLNLGTTVAW